MRRIYNKLLSLFKKDNFPFEIEDCRAEISKKDTSGTFLPYRDRRDISGSPIYELYRCKIIYGDIFMKRVKQKEREFVIPTGNYRGLKKNWWITNFHELIKETEREFRINNKDLVV